MIGSGISRNWQPRSFSWGMYQWIHFFCSPSRGTYSWGNIKYGSHTHRNTGPVNSQWTFLQLKPKHYAAVSDRTVKFALPLYDHMRYLIFIQLIHVEIFTCNSAFYLVFLQCLWSLQYTVSCIFFRKQGHYLFFFVQCVCFQTLKVPLQVWVDHYCVQPYIVSWAQNSCEWHTSIDAPSLS